jgi:hypothetical protein
MERKGGVQRGKLRKGEKCRLLLRFSFSPPFFGFPLCKRQGVSVNKKVTLEMKKPKISKSKCRCRVIFKDYS